MSQTERTAFLGASGLRLAAVGLLAAASTWTASAQTTETTSDTTQKSDAGTAEETVVLDKFLVESSFRGSLAAAAQIKQATPAIAEVIAAEDIGKLPDVSIADSLSRLTGLATQRLNGRSQSIAVRGLTADFTTGLLNGREQVSTGSNRAVEFDQYPSELLSGVVVYKTTQADLVGQGLAGTIDLRTVRPLTQGRRTIAANAYYDFTGYSPLNPDSDRYGIRYAASYIDQYDDGKLGIAVGYAHADIPGQGKQWNAWGYPNVGASVDSTQPYVLGGAKPFVRSSSLKRDGYMAVIEYKPTAYVHSTIDLYYSKFDETQRLRGIEIPLFWSSAQLQPGFTVEDGLITKGTFNNVFGVVRNDITVYKNDVYAAGWNLVLGDGSGWTTTADLNYSKIKRKQTVLETYSGTAANQVGTPDTIAYSLEGGTGAKFTPTLDYTSTSLLRLGSPQGWGGDVVPGGQAGYLKSPTAKDEMGQVKLMTKHDLPRIFSSVEIGGMYSDRYKSEKEDGYYLALANGASSAPLPTSVGVTDLSFIGIKGMASYDPVAALDSGIYSRIRNPNADVVSSDWKVEEKVALAFVQANIDQKVGTIPMTGNVGFQIVHTDQSSRGLSATGVGNYARYVPVSGGTKYWDFLPSMNLTFHVGENRYVRFSASRQMARQRMADMRAGKNFGYNIAKATSTDPLDGPWTSSGGNPELKPWRANSIDVAFEQYFRDNMGYFALSGFFKDLRTYTYTQTDVADFTGYPYDGPAPAIFQGSVSRPTNGDGGKLKGLEATLSLPSELINSSIKGFGLILGGSYTESSIEPYGPGSGTTPIPGLSRKIASATFYYEHAGFSARISDRYRSEYRGNIYTFGPRGENYRTIRPENVVDAQISYTIRSGSLKGVTFIVTANNLTDEPLVTEQSETDSRLVVDYQSYGPTYSAGVSYRF
ncbi:TonB-dependent receptor [Opitutaceae bacterium EW11]|nr:TonB-dependent receptor [Opitutaceae bacterium EW11]